MSSNHLKTHHLTRTRPTFVGWQAACLYGCIVFSRSWVEVYMQFAVMTVRNKFIAALILGFLLVVSGTVSAQNPDLSQNPAPSPDVQNQSQPPSPQDQIPQDQIQMQEQGQDQDQDQDVMQDQGQDQNQSQGPANPPTLGPRNDQQSPSE